MDITMSKGENCTVKRLLLFLLTLALLCACLAGCEEEAYAPRELTVFAAASMTETLTELGKQFEVYHPDVKITFNFASSGKLMDQILAGADCDLFVSAAPKQMNNLDLSQNEEKNPDRNDCIDGATRIDLLENKVALAVPAGNPKNVNSFDDLAQGLRAGTVLLAMGGEGVPVGQYTQKIFTHFGLEECGIIYQTDACSAKLTVVDTATEAMCGKVIYPAAVLKNAKNAADAKAFLHFLQTAQAGEVFAAVGFTPIKGE